MKPRLAQLHDSGAADGDVATYDAATGLWGPAAPGGGASALDDLTDVDTTTAAPTDGQVLTFDTADSLWKPATNPAGFADPTTTKGDLIVHGASTTRLPVGTDDYVLTADSTTAEGVAWKAASGSGSSLVTVDDVSLWGSALASATDYEFDANNSSSLPTGWSWVNQSTSTYLERFGAGVITLPASASDNLRMIVRSLPSESSWAATAKISYTTATLASSSFAGLVLRESASGELMTFGPITDTSRTVGLLRWNSPSSFNASSGSATQAGLHLMYLRITRNSATSYDFHWSVDGMSWVALTTAHNPSAFFTPDQIGFVVNTKANIVVSLACHWFRVR